MKINDPTTVAAVRDAFDHYERALMDNDLATLDALFWDHPQTTRYGPRETLYGFDAIQAFRKGRDVSAIARRLDKVWITAYGDDFATAFAEYTRLSDGRAGRQTQTWMRTPAGWRIVAAHVALTPAG
ncbi:MAG: oxalurate catabolism protein HpxZ [Pseudomonadota bacterium]